MREYDSKAPKSSEELDAKEEDGFGDTEAIGKPSFTSAATYRFKFKSVPKKEVLIRVRPLFCSSNTVTMSSWTPSEAPVFTAPRVLSYLQLPESYTPSPVSDPIGFLQLHIRQLPPHILLTFSLVTNPKQRTAVPTVRNRRLKYTRSVPGPPEFGFVEARSRWPGLWEGRERRGIEEGEKESDWVKDGFLGGTKGHIGKLGTLLGEYEEEREAERIRVLRRERAAHADFVPEEDSDSEDDDAPVEQEGVDEAKAWFERHVKEQFIYGLLDVSISANIISLPCIDRCMCVRELTTILSIGMTSWTSMMTGRLRSAGSTKMRNK